MTREEKEEVFDKLCEKQVDCDTCAVRRTEDFACSTKVTSEFTDEQLDRSFDAIRKQLGVEEEEENALKAIESCEKSKVGESTTDDPKVPIHATHEPKQGSEYDVVCRPQHYASTSIECIDAMRETQGDEAVKHYCVCNAFKYLWRHNSKNGDEDICKANWYLNKAVEIMEGEST